MSQTAKTDIPDPKLLRQHTEGCHIEVVVSFTYPLKFWGGEILELLSNAIHYVRLTVRKHQCKIQI